MRSSPGGQPQRPPRVVDRLNQTQIFEANTIVCARLIFAANDIVALDVSLRGCRGSASNQSHCNQQLCELAHVFDLLFCITINQCYAHCSQGSAVDLEGTDVSKQCSNTTVSCTSALPAPRTRSHAHTNHRLVLAFLKRSSAMTLLMKLHMFRCVYRARHLDHTAVAVVGILLFPMSKWKLHDHNTLSEAFQHKVHRPAQTNPKTCGLCRRQVGL